VLIGEAIYWHYNKNIMDAIYISVGKIISPSQMTKRKAAVTFGKRPTVYE
jgi:hypothetical protein